MNRGKLTAFINQEGKTMKEELTVRQCLDSILDCWGQYGEIICSHYTTRQQSDVRDFLSNLEALVPEDSTN